MQNTRKDDLTTRKKANELTSSPQHSSFEPIQKQARRSINTVQRIKMLRAEATRRSRCAGVASDAVDGVVQQRCREMQSRSALAAQLRRPRMLGGKRSDQKTFIFSFHECPPLTKTLKMADSSLPAALSLTTYLPSSSFLAFLMTKVTTPVTLSTAMP